MLVKSIGEMFKNKKELVASAAASSIFFSLLLAFPFMRRILTYKPKIKDFSDHIISSASASNLDIANRINIFYAFILGIIIIWILIFTMICKTFSHRYNEKTISFFGFIKNLSLVGIAGVIGSVLSAGQDGALYFVGGAVLLGCTYIVFNEAKNLDIVILIWGMLLSVPLSIFVWVFSREFHIVEWMLEREYIQRLQLQIDVFYFVIVWFLISNILIFTFQITSKFMSERLKLTEDNYKNIIVIATIPVLLTGIVQSIVLELFNVINKRNDVVFTKPILMYTLILILSGFMFAIIVRLLKRKSDQLNTKPINIVYKVYFPVILITLAFIIAQPSRMAEVGQEFFEMANHGLAVDHLFRYGSIPIIENFDAHMLYNQVFAYIYSLANGYEPWAAFLYDKYHMFFYVIVLFYLLKSLIGEINSFFFVLSFPLLENLFSMTYLISGIMVFSIYKYAKDNGTLQSSTIFWLAAGGLCIYRLDLGAPALVGGVLTCFITSLIYKRFSGISKFFLSGIILAISGVFLFVVLCILNGVSPKSRIIEFIKLCQSNQNWAYTNVGDNNLIAYVLSYNIIPIFVLVIVLVTIVKYTLAKKDLMQVNQQNLIMFLFFSIFFIFNISRGIVRHSLAEGSLTYTLGTFSLAILSFVSLKNNDKDRVGKFLIASIATVVLININFVTLDGSTSITTKAFTSTSYQQQYTETIAFKGTRVSGEIPSDARKLRDILDATLGPDETYFDFSSTNYFHALVERKNPVYVNQSPLLLSDDTTHATISTG